MKVSFKIGLYLFFIGIFIDVYGQNISFQRTIGTSGVEGSGAVLELDTHGYLLLGESTGLGTLNQEMLLVRTNRIGEPVWSETIGTTDNFDYASRMKINPVGNIIIGGNTHKLTGGSSRDFFITELDTSGVVLWQTVIGGWNYDKLNDFIITPDSGILAVGFSMSYTKGQADVYVVKLTKSGSVSWAKNYGGTLYDEAMAITISQSGNYLITGDTRTYGFGGKDMFLLSLNSAGNVNWFKTYGTTMDESGRKIIELPDSSIVIGGTKFDTINGFDDMLLVRTDKNGNYQWSRYYGNSNADALTFLDYGTDSTLYFGGYCSDSTGQETEGALIKTNWFGDTVFTRFYGKDSLNDKHAGDIDYLSDMQQTTDSGVVMTGFTESFGAGWDLYLIKTDINLKTACFMSFVPMVTDTVAMGEFSVSIGTGVGYMTFTPLFDNNFVNVGYDTLCLKIDTLPKIIDSVDTTGIFLIENSEVLLFPNPCEETLGIRGLRNGSVQQKDNRIRIYSATGILMKESSIPENEEVDVRFLTSGVYLMEIWLGFNDPQVPIRKIFVKE